MKTQPIERLKMPENQGIFPSYLKNFSSHYAKQFTKMKTQIVNHKDIDSYKNKFKYFYVDVQISEDGLHAKEEKHPNSITTHQRSEAEGIDLQSSESAEDGQKVNPDIVDRVEIQ